MESEQKKAMVSGRDKIDAIDTNILSLLKERLTCAKEMAMSRCKRGLYSIEPGNGTYQYYTTILLFKKK